MNAEHWGEPLLTATLFALVPKFCTVFSSVAVVALLVTVIGVVGVDIVVVVVVVVVVAAILSVSFLGGLALALDDTLARIHSGHLHEMVTRNRRKRQQQAHQKGDLLGVAAINAALVDGERSRGARLEVLLVQHGLDGIGGAEEEVEQGTRFSHALLEVER